MYSNQLFNNGSPLGDNNQGGGQSGHVQMCDPYRQALLAGRPVAMMHGFPPLPLLPNHNNNNVPQPDLHAVISAQATDILFLKRREAMHTAEIMRLTNEMRDHTNFLSTLYNTLHTVQSAVSNLNAMTSVKLPELQNVTTNILSRLSNISGPGNNLQPPRQGGSNNNKSKANNPPRESGNNNTQRRRNRHNNSSNASHNASTSAPSNVTFVEKVGNITEALGAAHVVHSVDETIACRKGSAVPIHAFAGGEAARESILAQNRKAGEVATVVDGSGHHIMYMMAKRLPFHRWNRRYGRNFKRLYGTAIDSLAVKCKESGIHELSMPAIGSGLDNLRWSWVKNRVTRAMNGITHPIAITVYHLRPKRSSQEQVSQAAHASPAADIVSAASNPAPSPKAATAPEGTAGNPLFAGSTPAAPVDEPPSEVVVPSTETQAAKSLEPLNPEAACFASSTPRKRAAVESLFATPPGALNTLTALESAPSEAPPSPAIDSPGCDLEPPSLDLFASGSADSYSLLSDLDPFVGFSEPVVSPLPLSFSLLDLSSPSESSDSSNDTMRQENFM